MKRIKAASLLSFCILFALSSPDVYSAAAPYEAYLGTFAIKRQNNHTVLLKWTTISEHNNDYFSIDYSTDGVDYTSIGKINSLGNTANGFSYEFIHAQPKTGKNYYTITMVGTNRKSKNSEIKVVTIPDVDHSFSLFPNPAVNNLTLKLNLKDGEELKVKFYDACGKKVEQKNCVLNKGKAELDLHTLPKGLYAIIVQVNSTGMEFKNKLVIAK